MRFSAFFTFFCFLFATTCFAAAPAAAKVQVQLMADVSSIRPGESFTVGLIFHIDPGWHIYWKNPGEAGLATKAVIKVPDGFVVSELQYPVPATLVQPGNVVIYGYEKAMMLTAKITPPATLKAGSNVPISATARWLVCTEETCVMGNGTAETTLPVGSASKADNQDSFAEWAARMPRAADEISSIAKMDLTGSLSKAPAGQPGNFTLSIDWKVAPAKIEWLPVPADAEMVKNVRIQTDGNRTTVRFSVTVEPNAKAESFESLVVFQDSAGQRQAAKIAIQ